MGTKQGVFITLDKSTVKNNSCTIRTMTHIQEQNRVAYNIFTTKYNKSFKHSMENNFRKHFIDKNYQLF